MSTAVATCPVRCASAGSTTATAGDAPGRLPDDLDALSSELALLGIDDSRPVLVYGDVQDGWGEDGRIAWMLRHLGHPEVAVLDGGVDAWRRAGGRLTADAPVPIRGTFTLRVDGALRASITDVAAAGVNADVVGAGAPVSAAAGASARANALGTVLLDTRSDAEWNGGWKYLPPRRGRIPGAVHLHWRDLLAPDGTLDRSPAVFARLRAVGITPERPVIAYCVGGVRSAWVTLALHELGFRDVRNYDGSWYEWSADRSRPVENP